MKDLIKQAKNVPEGRKVFIIRHGQTKLNAEDKIRGPLNIPLDEVGEEQAHRLGIEMRKQGIELDGLYVSDLLRTQQTALIISEETGVPILGTTSHLRPWDVGKYAGEDGKTAHKIMMEHAYNNPDMPVGGTDERVKIGETGGAGESFNIFKNRILMGIIGILNSHRGLTIGLVSHSRGERILHAWVAAGCPSDLEVDLEVFGEKGEGTATAQELIVNSPLVFT